MNDQGPLRPPADRPQVRRRTVRRITADMNESAWVTRIAAIISRGCLPSAGYDVITHEKLPYGYEIRGYGSAQPDAADIRYETDLLIVQRLEDSSWIPRVVIEAKINSINTHDAITYSEKASAHKLVHPYLRYGVILGNRRSYSLPGRLFRHGAHFDFMMSFKSFRPTRNERAILRRLIRSEVKASQRFEHILYEARRSDRRRYTLLQRRLFLK